MKWTSNPFFYISCVPGSRAVLFRIKPTLTWLQQSGKQTSNTDLSPNFSLSTVQNLKCEPSTHHPPVRHFRWALKSRGTVSNKTTKVLELQSFISKSQRHNSDIVRRFNYTLPQSAIIILDLVLPPSEPQASILLTTSRPSTTLPNTTCFPSSLENRIIHF